MILVTTNGAASNVWGNEDVSLTRWWRMVDPGYYARQAGRETVEYDAEGES